jgi:hypothetical protein
MTHFTPLYMVVAMLAGYDLLLRLMDLPGVIVTT